VSTTIGLAIRQRPPQPRGGDDYIKKLRMISAVYVILYDVAERRGWLVDGASALLHLLRKSLLVDESNNLVPLNRHTRIEDGTEATEAARSMGALQRCRDMQLFENRPEISKETKTKPSGETEEMTITKQTWYRVSDRINELYSDLEEIIGYQTDVSSRHGIGFKIQLSPRRRLEGFDFLDLASCVAPIRPKAATLKSTGWGWVDFARALHAITLFGRGFQHLIRPSDADNPTVSAAASSSATSSSAATSSAATSSSADRVCHAWSDVPVTQDYLSMSAALLQRLLDIKGDRDKIPWHVTDNIYLHSPDKSFERCNCAAGDGRHCDRVQILLPSSFL